MSWKIIFVSNAWFSIKSLWIWTFILSSTCLSVLNFNKEKCAQGIGKPGTTIQCAMSPRMNSCAFEVRAFFKKFQFFLLLLFFVVFFFFSFFFIFKQPDTRLKSRYLKIKRQNILNKFLTQTIYTESKRFPLFRFFFLMENGDLF